MNEERQTYQFEISPHDNQRLASLCGQHNQNIAHLEKTLQVEIQHRGNIFQIIGKQNAIYKAATALQKLYEEAKNKTLTPQDTHLLLCSIESHTNENNLLTKKNNDRTSTNISSGKIHHSIQTKNGVIQGQTKNQKLYLENIQRYDINFGIGPAGTGKTYLAVASAVQALENSQVKRVLLVRPAVEAGEKLGFLPGTLEDKISPYLRPLYDALFEMMGFEKVNKLISQNIIEIAPLAYMRGRTLNDAFIILDESQNTTPEQMKMLLTRLGFNSKAIITGDITQIDLPKGRKSGLVQAMEVLKGISEICFTHFDSRDVVRHPLVQRVIEAYEAFDKIQQPRSGNSNDASD